MKDRPGIIEVTKLILIFIFLNMDISVTICIINLKFSLCVLKGLFEEVCLIISCIKPYMLPINLKADIDVDSRAMIFYCSMRNSLYITNHCNEKINYREKTT